MHICLLDIDGTLVLTGGAGHVAFADTLAAEFGIAEISSTITFAGRSDRAIAMDLFREHGVEPSVENWQRFCASYLNRLDQVLVKRQGYVLPGVEQLLTTLANRGDVALGLLTGNVREGARKKLSHYGLWHWFPFGGFGDDHVERSHIAADALAAGLRHTSGNGSSARGKVLVIGDTPNDITCGRSIGAHCVAVPTGHTKADELRASGPDLLVETLQDIEPIVHLLDAP